ncbi:MAG: antitoxin [Gammaproteobacteria bacterium]|nr:antitoxin [Gammaproteobacteria bacterium]
MLTTLDIDEDLLLAVNALAKRESVSAGKAASNLIRLALTSRHQHVAESRPRCGFRPFPGHDGGVVTNELIDALREEGGD